MSTDAIAIVESPLPKARRSGSARAQKAIRCYRGLHEATSARQKRRWGMVLDQLLKEMTEHELAYYYREVRK